MKLRNMIFISIGFLSLGVGAIGVVLPILPTTPFLILASVFFAKGSEKFDNWFKETKIYKDYVEDFLQDRSMTLRRKIKILLFADLMIAFPLVIIDNIFVRVFLISVIIFKYYYFIFKIKTKR